MIVNSPESTDRAMELIFELLEDNEANSEAISDLVAKIEVYEDTAPELAEFNKRIKELDKN